MMIRRIVAGILGSVAGALPLLVVNVLVNGAGTFGAIESAIEENVVVFGAGALLGGVVLGGIVAGWMAGRRGGAVAAGVAGAIAAVLYAVMVILFVVGGAKQGWGPPIAALHPLRASAAICLVATLLLGIALLTGALVGRDASAGDEGSAPRSVPMPTRASGPGAAYPGQPVGQMGQMGPAGGTGRQQPPGAMAPPRRDDWREPSAPPRSPAGARPRSPGARSVPRDRR